MDYSHKFPVVKVPVLSKTIVFTLLAFSKTSPSLIMIPFQTPRLVPTSTAVGIAKPIAQGHATTSVAIPNLKANVNFE